MVALFDASALGSVLTTAEKRFDDKDLAIGVTDLRYSWASSSALVLDIAELRIDRGQRVFIEGPSGSGKSTLLALLAGIVKPRSGRITALGCSIDEMHGPACDRFRADHMGIIFQMFNLVPYLNVVENVTLPCRFSRLRREKAVRSSGSVEAEARRLLTHLNLDHTDLLSRPVPELSVGQQQRVAAARALMGAPEIIIADEPTSSLDATHRKGFIELLFEECRREEATLVFVGIQGISFYELSLMGLVCVAGVCIGVIPGYRIYRISLSDGMSVRV